ncbi:RNA polymerase II subunit A C-terminal domain phosphatase-like [Apostichopus japonicus]|uniref:RNA polymerase II subunit A C-terminal domain phosphatase-like n=1 Tax=Stichopus japonicus TaxID=307972 RepID=UPI003AB61021
MAAPLNEILWKGKTRCRIEKLKVKQGSHVSVGSLLVICAVLRENEEEKESEKPQIERLKSSLVGTVDCLYVKTGQTVDPGGLVMTVAPCNHPTVMKDMCADCGADLRVSQGKPGERIQHAAASVAMVHNIPELHVSKEVAFELAQLDVQSLLDNRKLVLIVDLDQTVIHTTMRHVKQDLPGVHHFQLMGLPWYHTKIRPGCKSFLEKLSERFQLHIFTMGSRPYAHTVARILDPDKKLFADRILSRDECFDPNSKTANLRSIFPTGDHMVCIIDDREDVWNFAPNLIHVKPYQYFGDTDDINIPPGFLPKGNPLNSIPDAGDEMGENPKDELSKEVDDKSGKLEEVPDVNQASVEMKETEVVSEAKDISSGSMEDDDKLQSNEKVELCEKDGTSGKEKSKVDNIIADSTTGEESSWGNVMRKNINNNEAANKESRNKDQKEANDASQAASEVEDGEATGTSEVTSSTTGSEDSDKVTEGLGREGESVREKEGTQTQNADEATAEENVQDDAKEEGLGAKVVCKVKDDDGDRKENEKSKGDQPVAKLVEKEEKRDPKEEKTTSQDDDCFDDYLLYLEEILMKIHKKFFTVRDHFMVKRKDFVPDVKVIVPSLRKKALVGVTITFSGVFPRNLPPERYRLWNVAISLGASVSREFVAKSKSEDSSTWTTHVIAAKAGTSKVHMARKAHNVCVVTPQWLLACWERWERVDERLFPLPKSPVSQSTSGSGRSTPTSESEPQSLPKTSLDSSKKQITFPERTKPIEKKSGGNNNENNSKQLPLSFCDDYNPLYSISEQEIKAMDQEVEDIFGESSSSNESDSDDPEEEVSIDSPSGQSLGSFTQDLPSSSDESLTAESPRGWKRKRSESGSDSDDERKDCLEEDSNSAPSDDHWTTDEERDEMADAIDDLLTYSTTARSFSTHMPK